MTHGAMAVSPDGRAVAFVARDGNGQRHLWVRELTSPTVRRLDGTDGADTPFWSPDGRTLGFFARSKLLTIPAGGGPVDTITLRFIGVQQVHDDDARPSR